MDDGFKVYTIKAGEHECNAPMVESTTRDAIRFIVKFDSSAIYETTDSSNQCDINKLYGFTDCCSGVHDNSARFGWRWFNHQLELHAYCYSNGQIRKEMITTVKINQEIYCMIKIVKNNYLFQVNEFPVDTLTRGCECDSLTKFMCFPYFGGTETAPHDITVRIKEL